MISKQTLRNENSNGLIYPSVPDATGYCIAAFWPDVVGIPIQERHIQYEWNGARITHYFDYSVDEWVQR